MLIEHIYGVHFCDNGSCTLRVEYWAQTVYDVPETFEIVDIVDIVPDENCSDKNNYELYASNCLPTDYYDVQSISDSFLAYYLQIMLKDNGILIVSCEDFSLASDDNTFSLQLYASNDQAKLVVSIELPQTVTNGIVKALTDRPLLSDELKEAEIIESNASYDMVYKLLGIQRV